MVKTSIGLAICALALVFGAAPVHAEEGIMPISLNPETDCVEAETDCTVIIEEIDEPDQTTTIDETEETDDDPFITHPTTTDNCSPATNCLEAEEEPAAWPMYLSLGALALVAIVFIVLNLFGGKRRK